MQLGQYKRAEVVLREGLAISERAGLLASRALANHNLGMAVAHNGDLADAEAIEREAIRAYAEQGDKRLIAGSRFYLSRILIARGQAAEAVAEMRSACTEVENVPAILPWVTAGLALALLAARKGDEALAAAKDAMKRTNERDGSVEGVRIVKLALAETLIANHQAGEGARVLNDLTVDLLEHASRLRDPELRRSFLHDVEENARAFVLQTGLAGTE
jgi:eukaryotic-like serine/threonine-protein kinase